MNFNSVLLYNVILVLAPQSSIVHATEPKGEDTMTKTYKDVCTTDTKFSNAPCSIWNIINDNNAEKDKEKVNKLKPTFYSNHASLIYSYCQSDQFKDKKCDNIKSDCRISDNKTEHTYCNFITTIKKLPSSQKLHDDLKKGCADNDLKAKTNCTGIDDKETIYNIDQLKTYIQLCVGDKANPVCNGYRDMVKEEDNPGISSLVELYTNGISSIFNKLYINIMFVILSALGFSQFCN